MTQLPYAFIKNEIVTNIALFEDFSDENRQYFIDYFNLDLIIPAVENAAVGGKWNGEKFILPQPYPSWILNENEDWVAPIEQPIKEGKIYIWNENLVSWDEQDEIKPEDFL